MNRYTLEQAAEIALCHKDTLRKLAASREVPSTKIGKRWIFPVEEFDEWVKARCRSIAVRDPRTGGYASPSLAERLAARRERKTASKLKNSKNASVSDSGDSISSAIVVQFAGRKSPTVT